ncbi:branched-chain amino acid ABC transporter substrate-binding protein [Burkholderia cepacia]|uniref:branched-chain amino acid ABC transporter substrate-binding protein n=1 Tax=Burkholderia cepacia TaxID=292 RepID=UPI0018669AE5|nr:branched-chain amino acid ABC transporter substrate-binding protein [Burkholderia cepacia]MBE2966694.1 branched-chain amino acid ABC transporter substrate-binding protein [Burkholderia cepacia]
MMSKKRTFVPVMVMASIGASSLASAASTETVKIGAALALTGGLAHLGKDSESGARLAVEETNAKGLTINGKNVVLVLDSQDDGGDPRTATQVAQKLADDKVIAVVGHQTSGTSIPASKIYSDAGIVQISPAATNPLYTQQGFKTTYRLMATDAQQGPALATFAAKQLGAKTVAVVDDATAYGQGLADQFAKGASQQGMKVISRDSSTDKTIDFKGILTKIKGENPDVIMYGGTDAAGAQLVKQAFQLGLRAKILGGDGMCTEKSAALTGVASKNLICSEASVPLEKMPGGPGFAKRFAARFNQPIQGYAPFGYDAVNVIVDAMKRANSTDPAKVLAALPATQVKGVIGPISFLPNGDLNNTGISVYQFVDGKKGLLSTVKQ